MFINWLKKYKYLPFKLPSRKQLKSMTIEEVEALGRNLLIRVALRNFNSYPCEFSNVKRVSKKNFQRIKVMSDGESVFVLFQNPIKFLPPNTTCCFDIVVNVTNEGVSFSSLRNPKESKQEQTRQLYCPSKQSRKHIAFVLQAIHTSKEVGSISDVTNMEDEMIIREYDNYYDIEVLSETQGSYYKIGKVSGRVYSGWHSHFITEPHRIERREIL